MIVGVMGKLVLIFVMLAWSAQAYDAVLYVTPAVEDKPVTWYARTAVTGTAVTRIGLIPCGTPYDTLWLASTPIVPPAYYGARVQGTVNFKASAGEKCFRATAFGVNTLLSEPSTNTFTIKVPEASPELMLFAGGTLLLLFLKKRGNT
jgi:hypothetical protein